jgi:hypothetical protein
MEVLGQGSQTGTFLHLEGDLPFPGPTGIVLPPGKEGFREERQLTKIRSSDLRVFPPLSPPETQLPSAYDSATGHMADS